ncbi:MAG TPA: FAD/NAD(P)-binding oxidoreductase [Candidatus Eisenbacteria bacterium]|nr:FAD/NAD(P)-binding oxidoreductase [Candidatus Eisenbacteria bacterium]
MATTLILGGGFGGLTCARALRASAPPDHKIVVVDRAPLFFVGATKTWVMLGEKSADEITRQRATLLPPGVELVQADVLRIDAATREVHTTAGVHRGDQLVIALGSEQEMGAVPGLAEAAHSFYGLLDALQLHSALDAFQGGRIVLLIPRVPFPCPPGPYEGMLLIHEWMTRRGIRDKCSLDVWTTEKSPMATAGPEMGKAVVGMLEERSIGFHPLMKTTRVEPARRAVRFEDGTEALFDLLITVPPHRVPRVAVDSWLAPPEAWIPVDPSTLAIKSPNAAAHVYAIGDVAGVPLPGRWMPDVPLALPKAGVMAAAQGEVVAANIAAALRGEPPSASFDGRGHCYIEVGGRRAMRGDGEFFRTPHPAMSANPPDEAGYRSKVEWIEEMLAPRR